MAELTLADLRLLGGKATKKKYGADHYKMMNKKSQEAKARKKNSAQTQPQNTP